MGDGECEALNVHVPSSRRSYGCMSVAAQLADHALHSTSCQPYVSFAGSSRSVNWQKSPRPIGWLHRAQKSAKRRPGPVALLNRLVRELHTNARAERTSGVHQSMSARARVLQPGGIIVSLRRLDQPAASDRRRAGCLEAMGSRMLIGMLVQSSTSSPALRRNAVRPA